MTALLALDVYQAACLAGGLDRAVDTAVVALLETGRIRAQRSGQLSVALDQSQHPVEAAVLAAIGTGGWRRIDSVRLRAGNDERLTALAEDLLTEGLLTRGLLVRLLTGYNRPFALTAAGRRMLWQLRADPPVRGATAGTSMVEVALHGPSRMPDRELRKAVFEQTDPDGRRAGRRRRRAGYAGGGATAGGCATTGGCAGPVGCGSGGGCGGAGCGGGGCGGG